MSTESDLTWIFPPRKSSTKTSGVLVRWLVIAGHLEVLQAKYTAESHPPLLLM